MASDVASMQPTIVFNPEPSRLARHHQRAGEAAGLVELDVDGIVAVAECGEAVGGVGGFVGADGHRAADGGKRAVVGGRERLLDQLEAGFRRNVPSSISKLVRVPGLVGVGDEARIGAGGADRAHPLGVGRTAAEFDLEQRMLARVAGARGHGVGRVEAERVAGRDGGGRRQAGQFPRAPARSLASRSHSAQSMPLRAAPGGIIAASASREATRPAPSIAATTPSTVSP